MERLLEVPLSDQIAEETLTTCAPFNGPTEDASLVRIESDQLSLAGIAVNEKPRDSAVGGVAVAVPLHHLTLQYPGVAVDGDVVALLEGLLPLASSSAHSSAMQVPVRVPVLSGVGISVDSVDGEDEMDASAVDPSSVQQPDLQRVVSEVLGEDSLLFAPVALPGFALGLDADA